LLAKAVALENGLERVTLGYDDIKRTCRAGLDGVGSAAQQCT
jgi:hypothetical protein